jgi:hypothetical protein
MHVRCGIKRLPNCDPLPRPNQAKNLRAFQNADPLTPQNSTSAARDIRHIHTARDTQERHPRGSGTHGDSEPARFFERLDAQCHPHTKPFTSAIVGDESHAPCCWSRVASKNGKRNLGIKQFMRILHMRCVARFWWRKYSVLFQWLASEVGRSKEWSRNKAGQNRKICTYRL